MSRGVSPKVENRLLVVNISRRMITELVVDFPGEQITFRDVGASRPEQIRTVKTDLSQAVAYGVSIRFEDGEIVSHTVNFGGAPRGRLIELRVNEYGKVF